ncbi:DUF86 domain-containing protein [Venenivibrio stagnispumantis]|uniref:Uncharacterized conserved protein, contains HEPN domain n=1 Tax=Venenivibrio stagnispumantis TaxID=407998 RepID=A0AA45WKK7_9AQUI|nr:DUF86 domain-containing protein [Venenivibrio stagnispumantis]MCW4573057.1 DUF86 domain-containing protein [Venenivibrio stagnispumantis]SMP07206.1 Uncharacterized conserved protein, contains HEPN domain [Venenivibrio stagnispumantis]
MSKREYKLFLKDILENIELIKEFTSNINSLEDLENSKLILFAVLKALENIGEAAKNIPSEIKEKYPYFCKEISGLRDIIVHHYWGVDIEIIWDVIENELDELENLTKKVLENEQ